MKNAKNKKCLEVLCFGQNVLKRFGGMCMTHDLRICTILAMPLVLQLILFKMQMKINKWMLCMWMQINHAHLFSKLDGSLMP